MKLQDIPSDQLLEELKSRGFLIGDSPMTRSDVAEMAYSNNFDLSTEQVDAVCKSINSSYDPELGINWWVIETSLRTYMGYSAFLTSTV
jgi:hypothetical protein